MRVLVLNAGSSSLKLGVVDDGESVLQTTIDAPPTDADASVAAVRDALADSGAAIETIAAVGHRIVHGGPRFDAPVVVADELLAELEALIELAPLHNGPALAIVRAARTALPGVVHVACFDTAFHRGLPELARRYPLPRAWHDDWGIQRYGFHGLSVQWASERAAALLGRALDELELVVAHLGSGASVTAVSRGRSVATSMGFTPLEGLMMGTRSGSIDPGIVLHLLRSGRCDVEAIARALEHDSGLRGVSGRSADVRALERAAAGGDGPAALALAMFADRAAQGIAAAATALPCIDALVFTGGIGEHAGELRTRIVARLAVLGLPAPSADESGEDRVLAQGRTGPAVLRVAAREDLIIARAVEHLAARTA